MTGFTLWMSLKICGGACDAHLFRMFIIAWLIGSAAAFPKRRVNCCTADAPLMPRFIGAVDGRRGSVLELVRNEKLI